MRTMISSVIYAELQGYSGKLQKRKVSTTLAAFRAIAGNSKKE